MTDICQAVQKTLLGLIASYLQDGTADASTLAALDTDDDTGMVTFSHTDARGQTITNLQIDDRDGEPPIADGVSLRFITDEPLRAEGPYAVRARNLLIHVTLSAQTGFTEPDLRNQAVHEIGARIRTALAGGSATVYDYWSSPPGNFESGSPPTERLMWWHTGKRFGFRDVAPEGGPLVNIMASLPIYYEEA